MDGLTKHRTFKHCPFSVLNIYLSFSAIDQVLSNHNLFPTPDQSCQPTTSTFPLALHVKKTDQQVERS